jgi:WD40 repeat protein
VVRCCKNVLTGEDNPNHRHLASAHSRSQGNGRSPARWKARHHRLVGQHRAAVGCRDRPAGCRHGGHDKEVLSAAFSPGGRRVITASSDSTARLWDVGAIPKGDLFAIACAWLPDYDLTYIAPDYGLTNLRAICQEGPPLFDGPWSSGGSP